jgi:hypothetical protein
MQMMPKINWPQRVASDAVARDETISVVLVVTVSSIPALLVEQHTRRRASSLTLSYEARLLAAALDTFFRVRFHLAYPVPNKVSLRAFRRSRELPRSPRSTTFDPYEAANPGNPQ